jgi:hypothetical protein
MRILLFSNLLIQVVSEFEKFKIRRHEIGNRENDRK